METTDDLKIKFTLRPCRDINDLLHSIFWKNPKLVPVARKFLMHVIEWGRSGSPHKAGEWQSYCNKTNLTQSSYHNMLKRLKRAGMVRKTYNKNLGVHEYHISDGFSSQTDRMMKTWNDFCTKR